VLQQTVQLAAQVFLSVQFKQSLKCKFYVDTIIRHWTVINMLREDEVCKACCCDEPWSDCRSRYLVAKTQSVQTPRRHSSSLTWLTTCLMSVTFTLQSSLQFGQWPAAAAYIRTVSWQLLMTRSQLNVCHSSQTTDSIPILLLHVSSSHVYMLSYVHCDLWKGGSTFVVITLENLDGF